MIAMECKILFVELPKSDNKPSRILKTIHIPLAREQIMIDDHHQETAYKNLVQIDKNHGQKERYFYSLEKVSNNHNLITWKDWKSQRITY